MLQSCSILSAVGLTDKPELLTFEAPWKVERKEAEADVPGRISTTVPVFASETETQRKGTEKWLLLR